MTITIEMENLQGIVQTCIEDNVQQAISETVRRLAEDKVKSVVHEMLNDTVTQTISEFATSFLENTTIKVGNEWRDEGVRHLTAKQYMREQFEEQMRSGQLRRKNRRGDYERVSYEEFVKEELSEVFFAKTSDECMKYVQEQKRDFSTRITQMFTTGMKENLSDALLQVLMENDTYKKVLGNIRQLGEGNGQ